MKKIFFAFCISLLMVNNVFGRVRPISGHQSMNMFREIANRKEESPQTKYMSYDELKKILQKSLTNPVIANPNTLNQVAGYFPSQEAINLKKESEKSFFQKVYDEAIKRVSQPVEENREDVFLSGSPIVENEQYVDQQKTQWQQREFPTIAVNLPPDDSVFNVPAIEHIPYLMNSIEVLPSGSVKFEETVVVIANGDKLQKGLTKILPKKIFNEERKSKKLDYSIINVSVNDIPVNYHLSSNEQSILFVPEKDYYLDPGVYTYKFEYLVDNLLWEHDNFYRFYWDIGGNGWNLVIDRLGASLFLPEKDAVIAEEVLVGSANRLLTNAVDSFPNGPWATAYIARTPLFIGEGMHLIADIKKTVLLTPSIWQKMIRKFYDWSDIYFSAFGFVVIFASLLISWRLIKKSKSKLKILLDKNPITMRYLSKNKFDKKSVCGFLLDLYRKNIIDIQQAGDTILLIKKTDKLSSLKSFETKALKQLFPVHETMYNLNKNNLLPFRRFIGKLLHGSKMNMLLFRMRLNFGYIMFSIAMLLLTEIFICSYKINALYVFSVLFITSLICLFGMFLSTIKTNKWLRVLTILISLTVAFLCLIIFSAVIHPLAALFLILTIITMVTAFARYSKQDGLIRQYIDEVASYGKFLMKHHDNIVLGKDFQKYQPAIWALDLEKEFILPQDNEQNKIPTMEFIVKQF